MEFLRYLLFFYAFLGMLIVGGLLFNKHGKAGTFLSFFALIYVLEQLDFLYVTSSLVELFPQFYMLWFPICLLAGPAIWFHVTQIEKPVKIRPSTYFLHLLPFFLYAAFTAYLLSFPGSLRVDWVINNYKEIIRPLNYGKTVHVLIYAGLLIHYFRKNQSRYTPQQKQYLFIIVNIYGLTAVLLTYLTAFVHDYIYFISYFVGVSTLVFFGAYVLYYQPNLFERLQEKYAKSGLANADKKRIAAKLKQFLSVKENIVDRSVNLTKLSEAIDEKKHHVSQTLSDEFNASFRELINKYRIDYAKRLLHDENKKDLKILAIAFESGFSNKSTFNRAFQKFAQCTPNEFRKKQVSTH